MKPLVSAAFASLAVLAAAPTLAQPMYGPPPHQAPGGWDLDRRLDWMQQRIDRGRADGSLDWREARRAQRELFSIRREEHCAAATGASPIATA